MSIIPLPSLFLSEISPLLREDDANLPEDSGRPAPELRARHAIRPAVVVPGGALIAQRTTEGPDGPRHMKQTETQQQRGGLWRCKTGENPRKYLTWTSQSSINATQKSHVKNGFHEAFTTYRDHLFPVCETAHVEMFLPHEGSQKQQQYRTQVPRHGEKCHGKIERVFTGFLLCNEKNQRRTMQCLQGQWITTLFWLSSCFTCISCHLLLLSVDSALDSSIKHLWVTCCLIHPSLEAKGGPKNPWLEAKPFLKQNASK